MKGLDQIHNDNRITSRDFGGMCQWFIFREGDLLACFVHKLDAHEFASNYEYENHCSLIISQAKP